MAALLCLTVLVGACGGDETDEALVGTFVDCDGSGDRIVFGADGSYLIEENGEVETATYTADGRTLTLSAEREGTSTEVAVTYYVNDTHFVFGAAYPEDGHDGVVGTWLGDYYIDEGGALSGAATTMVLRDDNTGSIRQVPYSGADVYEREGIWGPDPDEENQGGYELVIEETEDFTLHLSFQLVDDAVLGTPNFCRSDDN